MNTRKWLNSILVLVLLLAGLGGTATPVRAKGTATVGVASIPIVSSIVCADPRPSANTRVNFTVTFSEVVTGVNVADFSLTPYYSVTGATVAGVSGGPSSVYTVGVNTGSGNGAIRLDVPAGATITDLTGNPLGNLPYTLGSVCTINKTLTFISIGAEDGLILESSENSDMGGSIGPRLNVIKLGDNPGKKQYRSILSFSTGAIPDKAVITGVTLNAKKESSDVNLITIFQGLMADVKKGFFGITPALEPGDFQSPPCGTYGPFFPFPNSNNWYGINLTGAKPCINKLGTDFGLTQIRLRFWLDDNNNGAANVLHLYSGNAGTAANRPQLVIEYYINNITPTPTYTRTPTPVIINTSTRTPTSTAPTLTPTITPVALPDLIVSSVVTAPDGWTGGCTTNYNFGINVTIRNNGAASANAFVVDVNGNQQTVNSLAAGAGVTLWFAETDNRTITVDATGLVSESNESNNTFTYIAIVPTAPLTCTPTATKTLAPIVTFTPARTLTKTPTPVSGAACSPVTASITAPFTNDGAGTFCWQSTNLGAYINSWNLTSLTINGINCTNVYVAAGSLPAKINGYWYVGYTSAVSSGHFEAK